MKIELDDVEWGWLLSMGFLTVAVLCLTAGCAYSNYCHKGEPRTVTEEITRYVK